MVPDELIDRLDRIDSDHPVVGDVLQGTATLVLLFVFLHGWQRDLRVPIFFSHDALEYLMQAKGTIENGWWWVHPRLSAPGVFWQVLYPSNTNVDQALVWLTHLFSRNPAWCLNVSWILTVVLSAVIARRCLMLIGVRRAVAGPVGVLFALSPYALYLQPLFSLAIYLVPIPCTVALLVATNRLSRLERGPIAALAGGCVLVGFNYTYYAFFSCFLILIGTLIAYARHWNGRELARGVSVVALICLATAINLAPSWYAWRTLGKPAVMPAKHAAEADQYGLKIRHLVSPLFDHSFAPFASWNAREEAEPFAGEIEPMVSRLGVVATIGFLMLLGALFTWRAASAESDGTLFVNAARLTLAALLLATVGGFGSLFNLLVSPEIRAYSRLTPFIAFYSLVAIALSAGRWSTAIATPRRGWAAIMLGTVFVVGLYDQVRAADPMNRIYDQNRSEWNGVSTFVEALEPRLPDGAMVFQLPVLTYLSEIGREKMLQFDHIKPYIVSNRLHWSYPALADSVVRWQQQVGRLPPEVLIAAVVRQGFSAILVDRRGYPDNAVKILSELGVARARDAVLVDTGRYIAVDVRKLPKADVPVERLPRLGAALAATPGVHECAATTAHYLEWIADESAPFVRRPVRVSSAGDVLVSGWAVDEPQQQLAADVDIVVDDRPIPAFYGIDRLDVAESLRSADYRASGFIARLSGADVAAGTHTVSVRILSADRQCFYQGPAIQVVAR